MRKHIVKELTELISAGVISEETSEKIMQFYQKKAEQSPNRLVLVFGILGALLIGLGIILIIAHNWDQLSRSAKLFFSLLPLLIGQSICAFTLFKRAKNRMWREDGSLFLFFAIGASVSMVSQVYNIPGDLSGFLFIWMLLALPLVYIMRSAMTSLLVICGITWYACIVSYFDYPTEVAWSYWLMLLALFPFFWTLMRTERGNFFHFHQWFFAFSIIITLGMFNHSESQFMFVSYMSLFSLFVLLGETKWLSDGPTLNNAFLITGSLGSSILLLFFTFEWSWAEIANGSILADEAFVVSVLVSLLAAAMLMYQINVHAISLVNPKAFIFVIFIVLFALGKFQPVVAQWLTNVLVLSIAVITTWRGAERDNIVLLNYGLLIMAILIICRFFDTDMSFVVRGILFMALGLSFFVANYWVLKKRKLQDI